MTLANGQVLCYDTADSYICLMGRKLFQIDSGRDVLPNNLG